MLRPFPLPQIIHLSARQSVPLTDNLNLNFLNKVDIQNLRGGG
jgi:hypothetical protein